MYKSSNIVSSSLFMFLFYKTAANKLIDYDCFLWLVHWGGGWKEGKTVDGITQLNTISVAGLTPSICTKISVAS